MKQNSQTKHQKLENEEKNIFRIGYRWIAKKPVETVYRGKSLRQILNIYFSTCDVKSNLHLFLTPPM
jgi:hypothetical protein